VAGGPDCKSIKVLADEWKISVGGIRVDVHPHGFLVDNQFSGCLLGALVVTIGHGSDRAGDIRRDYRVAA
jgi:hypothetical protein